MKYGWTRAFVGVGFAALGLGAASCMDCPKPQPRAERREIVREPVPEYREPVAYEAPPAPPAVPVHSAIAPSISVVKSGPSHQTVGRSFTYDITVTNTSSDVVVDNVTVTDALPAGLAYESSNPSADVSGSTLTWRLGTLNTGESRKLQVSAHGTQSAVALENCVTVDGQVRLTARACTIMTISNPQVAVRKTGPETATVCDLINYTITVSNPGDGTATNVRVVDTMPAGVTTTDQCEWVIGSLAAKETRTFTVAARCNEVGAKTNSVTVTADGNLTASDRVTTNVVQPVLAIRKTGPADRKSGRPLGYEITVTNPGNSPVPAVVLEDPIPAGAAFQSASAGGVLQGNTVVWNLGTLTAGQSRTVTLECVATMIEGVVRNTATAWGECADRVSASCETRITSVPGILLECQDVDDPIEVGSTETYVIDVTNQGGIADTNIVIECTLPAEEEFVSASVISGAESPVDVKYTVSGKTVTFSKFASLAPKARLTYKVVVRCTAAGDVRFGVKLTSDGLTSGPVTETESTHIY